MHRMSGSVPPATGKLRLWKFPTGGCWTAAQTAPSAAHFQQRSRAYLGRPSGGTVCPPGYSTATPQTVEEQPSPEGIETRPGGAPPTGAEGAPLTSPAEVPDMGQLAGGYGASGSVASAAPGMIGDFFSYGGQMMAIETLGQDIRNPTTISVAGGDRRFKIVENNSPFPVDRVFLNYHHFENAVIPADADLIPPHDLSLDRYTFGLEKTFRDALWSVELRVPFARGLDAVQFVEPGNLSNTGTEFGNLGLALKRLVWQGPLVAASVGLGMVFPTADDMTMYASPQDVNSRLDMDNETFYLQPFVGVHYTPTDRLWLDVFSQADFSTNGNSVALTAPNFVTGPPLLVERGVLNDQNLLFLDASLGYWLYQNPCGCGIISAVAPIVELHYSTTMQDSDFVSFRDFGAPNLLANPYNRMDVLNLTSGLRVKLGECSYLTVAAAVPLRTEKENVFLLRKEEKLFDAEIGVQFVRMY